MAITPVLVRTISEQDLFGWLMSIEHHATANPSTYHHLVFLDKFCHRLVKRKNNTTSIYIPALLSTVQRQRHHDKIIALVLFLPRGISHGTFNLQIFND
jgi:hypothetical protein